MYRDNRVLLADFVPVSGQEARHQTALDEAAGDSCAGYGDDRKRVSRTLPSARYERACGDAIRARLESDGNGPVVTPTPLIARIPGVP